MSDIVSKISRAITEGDLGGIAGLTEAALAEGLSTSAILDAGLMPGMSRLGVQFKNHGVVIPEVLLSARTMRVSAAIHEPYLASSQMKMVDRAVIGTVGGDLHDVG